MCNNDRMLIVIFKVLTMKMKQQNQHTKIFNISTCTNSEQWWCHTVLPYLDEVHSLHQHLHLFDQLHLGVTGEAYQLHGELGLLLFSLLSRWLRMKHHRNTDTSVIMIIITSLLRWQLQSMFKCYEGKIPYISRLPTTSNLANGYRSGKDVLNNEYTYSEVLNVRIFSQQI